MSLLMKTELEELLRGTPSLFDGFDPAVLGTPASPVRGASVYLTVGQIFLPGTDPEDLGSAFKPLADISLEAGHTAVLRTVERIVVPANVAGIAFPPSRDISLSGLLTTNPGHVDPEYKGPLHLTVINMGKRPFHLQRGQRIMRLLLFRLTAPAHSGDPHRLTAIDEELLGKLSKDFLDVDNRTTAAAKKAVDEADLRIKRWQVWGPLAGGVLTALASVYALYWSGNADLKAQIARIDGRLSSVANYAEIRQMEERIRILEARSPRP